MVVVVVADVVDVDVVVVPVVVDVQPPTNDVAVPSPQRAHSWSRVAVAAVATYSNP